MKLSEYAAHDGLGLAALLRDGEISAAEVRDAAQRAIAAAPKSAPASGGAIMRHIAGSS